MAPAEDSKAQESDTTDSSETRLKLHPRRSTPSQAKAAGKQAESSDSESSDDSDSEEETAAQKVVPVTPVKSVESKTPNQAKATLKATPKTSAPAEKEESDTTDSSESEEEAPAKPVPAKAASSTPVKPSQSTPSQAKAAPKTLAAGKQAESSDSESSDDSESEEETPAQKAVPNTPAKSMAVKTPNQAKATLKATPKTMAPAEDEESDTTDSSESEEEAPAKPVPAKVASLTPVKPSQSTPSQAKAAPKTPAAGKQAESSDSESSDDSESGEEAPPQKAGPVTPAKVGSVIPSKGTPQATPKASAPAEEEESDTTDSSESEEESATSKVAAINKAVPVKQKAMPVGPGTAYKEDSSSSSVDSDSEEETALSKATSVVSGSSAVSALPTTVPETSSDSSSSEEDASQSLLTPKATPGKPTQKSKKTVGEEVNKKKAPVLSKDKNVIPKTPVATKGVKNSIPATPAQHDSDSDSTNIDLDDLKELTYKVVHAHKEKGGSICDSSSTSKKKSLASTPSQKKKASKQKSETKSAKAKKRKTAPTLPEAVNKEKMLPAQSPAVPAWRESESDSDSSLDVEKWKKLALRLSDADIAKMEEIDSLSANYSTQVLSDKSQKKKEKPKTKKGKAVGNGKDKASPKKSKPAASRAKKATGTVSESVSTSGAQGNFITLVTKAKSGKRPASALNTSNQDNHESSKKRKKQLVQSLQKLSLRRSTSPLRKNSTETHRGSCCPQTRRQRSFSIRARYSGFMQVRMWRLSQVRHKLRRDNSNFEEFKFKRREQERVLRQARRDQQLVSKRHLQENEEEEGAMDTAANMMSKEQIMELFRRVHHGGEEKVNYLQTLRKALRVPEVQLIFIKLENSMQVLVGLLSGSHAQCQLEAAYCLLELSHSSHPAAGPACLPATPYLLTYLSGQSDKFTELCLYTLGNLCAESEPVREKLLAQGIVPALASCIQRHNLAVVEAAGFVLSQLLQAKEAPSNIVPTVLASGITAHLLATLQPDPQRSMGSAIECAWSLHYLVCSNVGDETLLQQGTVSRCSSLLITLAGAVATGNTEEGVELLVWPLLRSVGNLLCGSRLESLQPQLRDSRLLPALCVLAHAFLQPYPGLARESLWVLNNLTADSSVFCSAVLFMNLVPGLIQLLPFSKGINCMVLQVLGNIAHQGTEYCSQLTQAGLLTALCTTLKMDDPHVVTLSLEVLIMILSNNSKMVEDFKKINGLCLLEAIQYNSQGEMRLRASYILDHHMTSCSQVDTPTV
ncbi:hypothetical protein AGOR_G00072780 [Albula goreensis]|uniref:Uncharacterized protein n=1 Tax=Albula goreensis TaxID=1534307 RepID=A0A8T3DQH5_9TELE|nr:hypothetical protein AGOR_G00072780 [Albula goreensis]